MVLAGFLIGIHDYWDPYNLATDEMGATIQEFNRTLRGCVFNKYQNQDSLVVVVMEDCCSSAANGSEVHALPLT